MTPVEIIAVIFAIVVLADFILVLMKPKLTVQLMESVYPKRGLMSAGILILAAIVGYYLWMELTVEQIFAGALFGMLIYGLILVQYPNKLMKFSKEVLKDKQKAMLPWLIFAVISVGVLYSAFA
jgi:hypothetical protein